MRRVKRVSQIRIAMFRASRKTSSCTPALPDDKNELRGSGPDGTRTRAANRTASLSLRAPDRTNQKPHAGHRRLCGSESYLHLQELEANASGRAQRRSSDRTERPAPLGFNVSSCAPGSDSSSCTSHGAGNPNRCPPIPPRAQPRNSGRRAGAAGLRHGGSACSLLADGVATEVLLCCQGVVRAAAQREIIGSRGAASCMRVLMMELEPGLFAAALAAGIDIGAARFVALPDVATDCGRDVPVPVR